MKKLGSKSRIQRLLQPGVRLVGLIILLVSAVWLLVLLHLAVLGRITVGRSARIPISGAPQDAGPVLYFYMIGNATYHGWRRGIEWGEQPLTVVYSPIWPRIHTTTPNLGLRAPRDLFQEPDFVLRLLLAVVGTGGGVALTLAGPWIERSIVDIARAVRASQ